MSLHGFRLTECETGAGGVEASVEVPLEKSPALEPIQRSAFSGLPQNGRDGSHSDKVATIDDTVESTFLRTRYPGYSSTVIALLSVVSLGTTCLAPVMLFKYLDNIPLWAHITFAAVSGVIVLVSIPTWITLMHWKPIAKRESSYNPPAVDILLTTYREHVDEIAGTLAAILNIDYSGTLNVYVLDDAGREDVAQLCEEASNARRTGKRNFPVTRVTRPTNEGKKGGNINNWLQTVPSTAEFLVTLDCDMRPFPNIVKVLLSHFFSYDDDVRRRIAFLQSPQFYRNYRPANDGYDVCLMHFVKTVMPCLDTLSTVPYIGTSALWRRDALVRAGGFIEHHVTEDVVTGCHVHRTRNEYDETYISKYVPVPVAAGLSPRTLPELIDQRLRWNVGLVQMTFYHRLFVFCPELGILQKLAYLATCGGWIANLILYFTILVGSLVANALIVYVALTQPVSVQSSGVSIGIICTFVVPTMTWMLLPGTSLSCRLRGIQMAFVYTSTQLVGLLYCLGLPVSIQAAADSRRERRWHWHFWIHIVSYGLVALSGAAAVIAQWQNGNRNLAPYAQVFVVLLSWTIALQPLFKSLRAYEAQEEPIWLELEHGRNDVFEKPVFSSEDSTAVEQMKDIMVSLVKRVDAHESKLEVFGASTVSSTSGSSEGDAQISIEPELVGAHVRPSRPSR